ncbi:MAG: ASCH domain-containing protein [Pseudomonadota bacterium]
MRNMSFFMTTEQVIARKKFVTRRFGWKFLKVGDQLNAVRKAQGLKRGEKVEGLARIEVTHLRWEPLNAITQMDCISEGFPEMEPHEFVEMLSNHYRCAPDKPVHRIEFRILD